ncbi:MAG: hypothetical protein KJZ53_06515 [Anaerolineales bacterium]|nr:hypothetical protein [Anaerolineales bacterium]
MAKDMLKPAEQLEGLLLKNRWEVVKKLPKPPNLSGGNFSIPYEVKDIETGQSAFLKALDYSGALQSRDPARELQAMTEAYNFERDLLMSCRTGHMDRVVTSLDDGSVSLGDGLGINVVQFIVFELANGNIRSLVKQDQQFDTALSLRALHNIATGLSQLHSQKIAHQDLKPSNISQTRSQA